MSLEKRPAYWTCDSDEDAGHLYTFRPTDRSPGPYTQQRRVQAIIDIAADGTLAGVELIDDMPPPPKPPDHSEQLKMGTPIEVIPMTYRWEWRRYAEHGPFFLCRDGVPLQAQSVFGNYRFRVCAAWEGVDREIHQLADAIHAAVETAAVGTARKAHGMITTEIEYEAALKRAERLMDIARTGTPEGAELAALAAAIEAYEDVHHPIESDEGRGAP